MESLEKYLTEEHPFDLRDIAEIEKLIISATETYKYYFDDIYAWPYEINAGQAAPKMKKLSVSTTAMILYALLRAGNYFSELAYKKSGKTPIATVFPINLNKDEEQSIREKITRASKLLLANILKPEGNGIKTDSGTFGKDDVFTFAWLAEVSMADWTRVDNTKEMQDEWDKVKTLILDSYSSKKTLKKYEKYNDPTLLFKPSTSKPLKHSFPLLRFVQTIRQIKGKDHGPLPLYEHFEKSLHEQLSFSSIPDSRFDPAEAMFCLEGMLLCQKNTVDRTLFERVIEVLTQVQHENANWRPVKPYLATPQGLVLFPISIEVANSLLRACTIFDGNALHDTFGSKSILLLRRYCQWLKARSVRLPPVEGKEIPELVGWHSEHVNDTKTIHLWETSQVIEFLLSYRNALQAHVARTTLVRSRFSNKLEKKEEWSDIKSKYEPVTSLGYKLQIYNEIEQSFIEPHLSGKGEKNYSMLLYGPPGTGKTTVAENIAKALKRNLIQITVSDFLEGGGAQVEARAKNIFAVLMAQPSSVVLFDEIDHFLLDRDSQRYSAQDTLFQFMTPGMLTKLNDLRRKESVIFIIATNYEDRIDSAIKRVGRIDKKYIVLPPDLSKRIEMLKGITKDVVFSNDVTDSQWSILGAEAVFLGYNDIKNAVSLFKQVEPKTVENFKTILGDMARTTSLEAYTSRFSPSSKDEKLDIRKTPLGEFLCLVALRLETISKIALTSAEQSIISKTATLIKECQLPDKPEIELKCLKKYSQDLDVELLAKVAKALTETLAEQPSVNGAA